MSRSKSNYKLYSDMAVSESTNVNNASSTKIKTVEDVSTEQHKNDRKPLNTKMAIIQGKHQKQQGMSSIVSYLQHSTHLGKILKDPSNIVVVCATASWCKPCQALAPKFENLAGLHLDCIFHKDDIDAEESVHKTLVSSVPTFFVYHNNQRTMISGLDFDKMEEMVKKLKLERNNKSTHMMFRN